MREETERQEDVDGRSDGLPLMIDLKSKNQPAHGEFLEDIPLKRGAELRISC